MKKTLRIAALAAIGMAALVTAPTASAQPKGVTIYDFPYGIFESNPPQGLVSLLGPNKGNDVGACPEGVGDISLDFNDGVPERNPEAEGEICLYKNGELIETLPATAATVDAMGASKGGFRFYGKHTDPGVYHITIPEGTWLMPRTGDLSPAVELGYEIFVQYKLNPTPGVVNSLNTLDITFPGAVKVTQSRTDLTFYAGANNYNVSTQIGSKAPNVVTLTFLSENGLPPAPSSDIYMLALDPSIFTIYYDAEDAVNNPTGIASMNSDKIFASYNILPYPKPEMTPAEGQLLSLGGFELKLPTGFNLIMANDMARATVMVSDDLGSDGTVIGYTRVAQGSDASTLKINLYDEEMNPVESLTPAPGKYVVVVPKSAFSGTYEGAFCSSPELRYVYEVISGGGEPVEIVLPEGTITNYPEGEGYSDLSLFTIGLPDIYTIYEVDGDLEITLTYEGGDYVVQRYRANLGDNVVEVRAVDNSGSYLDHVPCSGDVFDLHIPAGLYKASNVAGFGENEAAVYSIKTKKPSIVSGLQADNSLHTVYSVTGVRVADKASSEALKNLPKGIYIVNGKKIAVK